MKSSVKTMPDERRFSEETVNDLPTAASKQGELPKKKPSAVDRARELALVERARTGDHSAFEALFNQYRARAYSVALGVLKNPEDAKDAVQEAFIKAYRNLERFQGTSSFYTWFYRILMNLCIDQTRKRKRAPKINFEEEFTKQSQSAMGAAAAIIPSMQNSNPSRTQARKELRVKIEAALQTISEEHRAVILLREIEAMSYDEIAQTLEIPKGTVMSRLFHARKKMQEALAGYVGKVSS